MTMNSSIPEEKKKINRDALACKPELRRSIHRAASAIKLERDDGYAKRHHAALAIKPERDDKYSGKASCRA